MVKEIVVTSSLTDEMILAGAALVRGLDKARLTVSAALWLYLADTDTWRFIVASPEVRIEGPKKMYKKVLAVIAKLPADQPKIPLKDISVTDTKDTLISSLRTALRTKENNPAGIRFSHNVINGVPIDDAYIYRVS